MKATPAKARFNYSPQKQGNLLGAPAYFLPEVFLLAIMFWVVVLFCLEDKLLLCHEG